MAENDQKKKLGELEACNKSIKALKNLKKLELQFIVFLPKSTTTCAHQKWVWQIENYGECMGVRYHFGWIMTNWVDITHLAHNFIESNI